MNISIPYTWLKDHLDTQATPEQLQTNLSLCGPSVESINEIEGDQVFDIEVTTNRVDMMSVRGIAREAAAILPEFGINSTLKPLPAYPTTENNSELDIHIQNDPNLCHRILAIKLTNVKVGPSPEWLQKRLLQVGQRPLNNLIDITNYLMWDLGHPVHVFDYDKFTKKTLIVREAKKGEVIHTLDDKKHTTVGGEVVFDDGTGEIIDMPGIMGTLNTAVDDNTQNIIFFIDSVKAEKIRFASMSHSIRSQAAILNEKNVDPELALASLQSGIKLYQDIAGAQIGSAIKDIYPHPPASETATVTQEKIDTYLGIHIEPDRIKRILQNLGCDITISHEPSAISYIITPPSYRYNDLKIPQDYIEEIARIYGYHNLSSVIMNTPIPNNPVAEDFRFEHNLKQNLVGWGLSEVYTYSMVSDKLALQSGYKLADHLKIKNPLSDDWVYLRRSLLPSLSQVLTDNPTKDTTIFELQNIYIPKDHELPTEKLHLTIITTKSYSHLKGILDALMQKYFIKNYSIKPIDNQSGEIYSDNQLIGLINKNSIDIVFADFYKVAHTHPQYIPVITTPSIIEDLTFTIPEQTYIQPIIDTIKATNPLITSVVLKDIYHQNYTFTLTYRHPEKNLTDQEITPIRNMVVNQLKSRHNAVLVGTIN